MSPHVDWQLHFGHRPPWFILVLLGLAVALALRELWSVWRQPQREGGERRRALGLAGARVGALVLVGGMLAELGLARDLLEAAHLDPRRQQRVQLDGLHEDVFADELAQAVDGDPTPELRGGRRPDPAEQSPERGRAEDEQNHHAAQQPASESAPGLVIDVQHRGL